MAEETAVAEPAVPTEGNTKKVIEGVVAAAEKAYEAVAKDAEAATKTVEAKVVEFTTAVRVDITVEEKLMVSKLENDFLRAQADITRLQSVVQNAQVQFPRIVEGLIKKYAINPATHVFDNIELAFKKKQ